MTKTLEKIINYAVKIAQPEEVILFGSVAEGKNNVHSDVDLLIITDDTYLKSYFEKQIKGFARELSLAADVLIHSRNELENASLNSFTFLGNIMKYGKIIYKKTV